MSRLTFRQRRGLALGAIAALTALAACSDARVRKLSQGISRDSALVVLGGTSSDAEHYIYHDSRFIDNGRQIEVLYYDPQGRKRFTDSVAGKELTPIALEDGKVVAWGWGDVETAMSGKPVQLLPHE